MDNLRQYIAGTETRVPLKNGKKTKYINFDNAATTPPLKTVLKKIKNFAPWYSSIHRGKGYKSRLSSEKYEMAREIIANFLGADSKEYDIIFVENTTAAINKLAWRLQDIHPKKDIVLTTEMEHHSNDLPWRKKYRLIHIRTNKYGRLDLGDLESKLIKYKNRVKLVTVTGASNITGYINPIYKIAGLAHSYGALIMVDGAQLVPHRNINLHPGKGDQIDFLAFSGHKMYAPFGTGVLITPAGLLSRGWPEYSGGGTVKLVTRERVQWKNPPQKEEAGTPNIMGVIALAEAVKKLQELGLDRIAAAEEKLFRYTYRKLKEIKGIHLYQNLYRQQPVAIIPFNIRGLDHGTTAHILSCRAGIAVRNGCFCAQPYMQKLLGISQREINIRLYKPDLPHPGMVRISFGMYNQKYEVDKLIDNIKYITNNLEHFRDKYGDFAV